MSGVFLAGCGLGSLEMAFVVPGSYDYLNCEQIAGARTTAVRKQDEAQELTQRAEAGSFGSVIAATTYRPQALRAAGEIKLLDKAAREKNCETPAAVQPR